jgi:hypothetical protein
LAWPLLAMGVLLPLLLPFAAQLLGRADLRSAIVSSVPVAVPVILAVLVGLSGLGFWSERKSKHALASAESSSHWIRRVFVGRLMEIGTRGLCLVKRPHSAMAGERIRTCAYLKSRDMGRAHRVSGMNSKMAWLGSIPAATRFFSTSIKSAPLVKMRVESAVQAMYLPSNGISCSTGTAARLAFANSMPGGTVGCHSCSWLSPRRLVGHPLFCPHQLTQPAETLQLRLGSASAGLDHSRRGW